MRWGDWLRDRGLSALEASLGFVLRDTRIDRTVVGVETSAQLREIVASASALEQDVPRDLVCDELDLIDPSRWRTA